LFVSNSGGFPLNIIMLDTSDRPEKLVIADGNTDVRSALRCVIEQEENLIIAGEAGNWRELTRLLGSTRPGIVFLDSRLPGAIFPESLRLLNWDYPDVAIVLMTSNPDSPSILCKEVCCCISKKDPPEMVHQALRSARLFLK
jgi:DNA-binding NarL/FixJ family response regulator